MAPQAPAGWYPDPAGSPAQRWWDGTAWTSFTEPAVTQPAAAQPAAATTGYGSTVSPPLPVASAPPGPSPYSYPPMPQGGPARAGAAQGNRLALITFAVVALYVVIALETRFVVFGFLPLALSLRSKRQGEPLAPLAIGAAVLSIVIAVAVIFGH
jgi:hypothetical protein